METQKKIRTAIVLALISLGGALGLYQYLGGQGLVSPKDAQKEPLQVLIYTRAGCSYCVGAKRLLVRKGLAFKEIDIGRQPEKHQEMLSKAAGRTTVPQIFFGEHGIGGFDDLRQLDEQGELDALVQQWQGES